MATSGSTLFQLSRDDIINAAYRKLLVLDIDSTATPAQITNGAQALNAIVASYQTLGMSVWARKQLVIPLVSGQSVYSIGVGKAINTPFPLHVYQAVLEFSTSGSQIDINMLARYDYNLLPASSGTPVNATYQPFINYGEFSIWPTPDASVPANTKITITYQAPFEYFVASTDTPSFPQEWVNALIYELAVSLASEVGLPLQDRAQLMKEAERHLNTALSTGAEDASLYFSPNTSWR